MVVKQVIVVLLQVIIAVLLVQTCVAASVTECGRVKINRTDLILGGRDAKAGEWPWHAGIYHRSGRTTTYACGGALISKSAVITAAHCVMSEEGYQLSHKVISVRLGIHRLSNFNRLALQIHDTLDIYPHPEYSFGKPKSDIALLELKTVVEFTGYVQPVCINQDLDLTSSYGTVIGWGLTEADEPSDTLREARIPVIDGLSCLETNRNAFGATLDSGMYCAGFQNGTGACNGDSGSGMYFNRNGIWQLGGIVSFIPARAMSSNLCHKNSLTVFTNVVKFLSWIKSTSGLESLPDTSEKLEEDNGSAACTTPANFTGFCVPLPRCRNLHKIIEIQVQLPERIKTYIEQAACELPEVDRSVCCQQNEVITDGLEDLLPSNCGVLATKRIFNGKEAELFEHPWMALLMYRENDTLTPACGGTLISKRYVLAGASCLKYSRGVAHVRLGEHTLSTKIDCQTYRDKNGMEIEQDCADPAEDIAIESFVAHPEHNARNRGHDIGLVRLVKDVVMKDHIRPICLPVLPRLRHMDLEKYIIAGWGRTESGERADTLLTAVVPLVPNTVCLEKYQQFSGSFTLNDSQICAGSELGDTCAGDSGGPLGYSVENYGIRFVQFGISSFGVARCGSPGIPSVYTRVGSYIDWILLTMRP